MDFVPFYIYNSSMRQFTLTHLTDKKTDMQRSNLLKDDK